MVDGGKGRKRDIELGGVESKWQKEGRKKEERAEGGGEGEDGGGRRGEQKGKTKE